MSKNISQSRFTRSMFIKSVLFSPLAGLGLALAEIGDCIIVGHKIGMKAIAAVGYISPLFLIISFLAFGISTGGAIIYNDLLNKGKEDEALDIFNTFVLIGLGISIFIPLFCLSFRGTLPELLGASRKDAEVYEMTERYMFFIALGAPFAIISEILGAYMRNDKNVTFSVALQTACGISNLLLSAVLLFVFGFGIEGCSFGYFISNFAAVMINVIYIILSKGKLRFRPHFAKPKNILKPLHLGFATSSEYIFGAVFTLAFIHVLSKLGGVEGVAVYNIIENLSMVFVFVFELIGKTAQPVFTAYHAEHNIGELRRMLRYCAVYSFLIGTAFVAVIRIYPESLKLIFGMEGVQDISAVYHAASVFGVGAILMGQSLLTQNFTQSEGNEKDVFFLVFIRKLGLGLPILLLLSLIGENAVWFVYPLTESLSLAVFTVFKHIMKSKKGNAEKSPEVYCTCFFMNDTDLFDELDSIDAFLSELGYEKAECLQTKLSLEEICHAMIEHKKKNGESLIQLTITAQTDGSVEVHLRNNDMEYDPFNEVADRLTVMPEIIEEVDFRGLGLLVVRYHARNLLYRNYQGFNTLTYRIKA